MTDAQPLAEPAGLSGLVRGADGLARPMWAATDPLLQRQVPKDIWQDIFAKYLALADPAAGLAQWDRTWGDG